MITNQNISHTTTGWDSLVSTVTWLKKSVSMELGFHSLRGTENFIFVIMSRPAHGPTRPSIQLTQPLSSQVKQLWHDGNHSPPQCLRLQMTQSTLSQVQACSVLHRQSLVFLLIHDHLHNSFITEQLYADKHTDTSKCTSYLVNYGIHNMQLGHAVLYSYRPSHLQITEA